jgi:transcriptional regulator with XRE-family HTH domain
MAISEPMIACMKIGELFRLEREKHGWSQSQVARKAGVSSATISRIEAGERGGGSVTIARIAATLGLDPAITQGVVSGDQEVELPRTQSADELLEQYVAARKREREEAERKAREAEETRRKWFEEEARAIPLPDQVVMVPVVPTAAGAGPGQLAETQFWPFIPSPESLGHKFVAVRVQGSCLKPRILDGDLAIIDRNAVPQPNSIVAVEFEGEIILRIWEGARLVSTNGHPPLPVNETVRLEGVVVSIVRSA